MISVIIPTLNEALTIGDVIDHIQADEILVVDGGSIDGTREIARGKGARVILERRLGYGRAYRTGWERARGDVVVMIDGDGTYDPEEMSQLIASLPNADLVVGNRFGGMEKGAMVLLNRVGNWAFTFLIRLSYHTPVRDSQSGMRAIRREALERLTLTEEGMPLATEMLIQAAKHHLRVVEVPIHYRRRRGKAKLHPFRDGWGILKCILQNL